MEQVQSLIDYAFKEINQKYNGLAYHNIGHTKFVVESATALAQKGVANGKIGQDVVDLIAIAAAYHDIEQSLGPGQNEQASANIATGKMQATNVFNAAAIQLVYECILATAIKDFDMLTQSANNYLPTQLVADADLASLGSPFDIYFEHANNYFKELNPTASLNSQQYYNYLQLQQKVLTNHKFYSPEANQMFRYQSDNLGRINQLIAKFKVE